MTSNIIIVNPEKFALSKAALIAVGAEKLHLLCDFDRTLTSGIIDGQETPSLVGLLKAEGLLNPDYDARQTDLFNHYRPIERDPQISVAEKKTAMEEWWRRHYALLVESKLKRSDLEQAVQSRFVQARAGLNKMLELSQEAKIPVVILSATGLGREAIEMFFEFRQILFPNIHIISNAIIWDEEGIIKGIKEPIITSLNKNETLIHDLPCFEEIKDRPNVILLGDSPHDIDMLEGLKPAAILKIGFLDDVDYEPRLASYRAAYDVVVLGNGSLDFVNELLVEIIKK